MKNRYFPIISDNEVIASKLLRVRPTSTFYNCSTVNVSLSQKALDRLTKIRRKIARHIYDADPKIFGFLRKLDVRYGDSAALN